MAFLMNCNNKGCGKSNTPYLSLEDNEVYCSECDKIIQNVSHFTKTQMKSLKQVKKDENKSFSVKCEHCKRDGRPNKKLTNLFCKYCNKEITHLTPIYKKMLLSLIDSLDKDV